MKAQRPATPEIAVWSIGLFFLGLTLVWCGPILTDPVHRVADVGDPLHLGWVMAWVGHQLVSNPFALFESNSFHPYRGSLVFGDHLLPEALVGLPFNLWLGNPVLAINVVTGLGLFTSAASACFLLSRLLGSRIAGLVAGTALAFNAFTQNSLLRVHTLQLQGWCLAAFCIWRFTEKPSWRYSTGAAFALALQGLSGSYYALYTVPLAPAFVLSAYLARRRPPRLGELVRLTVPAALVGISCLLFLSPYRQMSSHSMADKPIEDGVNVAAFLLPAGDSPLYQGLFPVPPKGEGGQFVGFATLALALGGAVGGKRPEHRFIRMAALSSVVIGAVIALGPFPRFMDEPLGTSPYFYMLRSVGVLRGMASVERAGVLVHVGLALLAGLGALSLFRNGAPRPALAFALAALLAAEQWSDPPAGFRVPVGKEMPEVYSWLARGTGPLVDLPVFPDNLLRFRALYLYFSTYHWRPIPIGRTSFYPPSHDYLASLLQGFPDEISIAALRELEIKDLVVHPLMWEVGRREHLRRLAAADLELVRTFPEEVSAAASAVGLGDERIYRIRPSPTPRKPCRATDEIARETWRLRASADNGLNRLRDGLLDTAWSTIRSQREGDFLEVELPAPHLIAAVELTLGSKVSDFPLGLRVETSESPDAWQEAEPEMPVESAMETLRALTAFDRRASITLRLPPRPTRFLRLRLGPQAGRLGWNAWSVAEMHLYANCS